MVPLPVSNNTLVVFTLTSTEQLLRFNDGTQVPDPNMVTVHALLRELCVTVALEACEGHGVLAPHDLPGPAYLKPIQLLRGWGLRSPS